MEKVQNIAGISQALKMEPALEIKKGEIQKGEGPSFQEVFQKVATEMTEVGGDFQQLREKTKTLLSTIPAADKKLIELQMTVNHLGIKMQFMSQVGEAVSSSLKKIQQMG